MTRLLRMDGGTTSVTSIWRHNWGEPSPGVCLFVVPKPTTHPAAANIRGKPPKHIAVWPMPGT